MARGLSAWVRINTGTGSTDLPCCTAFPSGLAMFLTGTNSWIAKPTGQAMETNRIRYSEFATDPNYSFEDMLKAILQLPVTDSAKVNVAKIGEKVLALSETSMQIQIDPATLNL
jgi:cytochrome bd-type quinol oxidase subunit 1